MKEMSCCKPYQVILDHVRSFWPPLLTLIYNIPNPEMLHICFDVIQRKPDNVKLWDMACLNIVSRDFRDESPDSLVIISGAGISTSSGIKTAHEISQMPSTISQVNFMRFQRVSIKFHGASI